MPQILAVTGSRLGRDLSPAPLFLSVRGRFEVGRPFRPYAWAVEASAPGAAMLLQQAIDSTASATKEAQVPFKKCLLPRCFTMNSFVY